MTQRFCTALLVFCSVTGGNEVKARSHMVSLCCLTTEEGQEHIAFISVLP